jgi:hypothetical protein
MNLRDAGVSQHNRAGLERRTRCADVVDEHHSLAFHIGGAFPHSECATKVVVPLIGSQFDLRHGMSDANQRLEQRWSETPRQLPRLVEAARPLASGVQWYRHHTVGVMQHRSTALAHENSQAIRDRVTLLIFQRVNKLSQRAVVFTNRAPAGNQPRMTRAVGTDGRLDQRREGIPADIADRRIDAQD